MNLCMVLQVYITADGLPEIEPLLDDDGNPVLDSWNDSFLYVSTSVLPRPCRTSSRCWTIAATRCWTPRATPFPSLAASSRSRAAAAAASASGASSNSSNSSQQDGRGGWGQQDGNRGGR